MNERPVNVGINERLAAAAFAGMLAVKFLRRPSLFKLATLGCLGYRAVKGHCFGYEWLGMNSCQLPEKKQS